MCALALPCSFRTLNCGYKGKCVNKFNDYSCACSEGTFNYNQSLPSSPCVTDFCYNIDCKRGICEKFGNDYRCACESGKRLNF